MNDSYNYSPSRASPHGASKVFDPFLLRPNHQEHHDSTSIIRIEGSGKIFCPICLDTTPEAEILKVSEDLFNQYVRNLFEALEQYTGAKQLKKIILPVLGTMLRKRNFKSYNDYDFHKYLRIINKIVKSDEFIESELTIVCSIFASLISNYVESNPVPLDSIWRSAQMILKKGESFMNLEATKETHSLYLGRLAVCGSIAIVATAYLRMLSRFSIGSFTDLLFPIYDDNLPEFHCRKRYNDSQMFLIKFITETLLPNVWKVFLNHMSNSIERKRIAGDMFEALVECIYASKRLKYHGFTKKLVEIDILSICYCLLRANNEVDFRLKIRSFLKVYILHYVELDLGTDEFLEELVTSQDYVEHNHKNTIRFCHQVPRYRCVVLYILMNFVAIRQDSKYYKASRVSNVLSAIELCNIDFLKSLVFLKAINFVGVKTARTYPGQQSRILIRSITILKERLRDRPEDQEKFDEAFCFDSTVFFNICDNPTFVELTNTSTIKYILEKEPSAKILREKLLIVLDIPHYRSLFPGYLIESDESASTLIRALKPDNQSDQTIDEGRYNIDKELGVFLSSLFHEFILDSISYSYEAPQNDRLLKMLTIINSLLNSSDYFTFTMDNQFIVDLFKLIERVYVENLEGDEVTETLILMNELLTQLIITNNSSLMQVLYYLDFRILGYMYSCISDYTKGDLLCDSIARLLVAYNDIDYPIRYLIADSLTPMAESIFYWTLSSNSDLHKLSLIACQKILANDETTKSVKVMLAIGLIHMINSNSRVVKEKNYERIFLSILKFDELRYNPLLDRIKDHLPRDFINEIQSISEDSPLQDSGTYMSFDSSNSSDVETPEDDEDDDRINIEEIFNAIDEDGIDKMLNHHSGVPSSMLTSESATSRISATQPNLNSWEKLAYETHRSQR